MLSRAYQNIVRHQDKPALGNVNPPLGELAANTNGVLVRWRAVMDNEGQRLASDLSVIRGWTAANGSSASQIIALQNSIAAATSAFGRFSSDLDRLRSKADSVIETARSRAISLQADVDRAEASLKSKQSEFANVESTIADINKQIADNETAARQLDDAAHSARRHARRKKKRGVFGGIVGIVAAPFTMGASLALTAVGVGEIHSADEAFRKASQLRDSANAQRAALPDLQAKLADRRRERDSIQSEVSNKKQEIVTLNDFISTVRAAVDDLLQFESSLTDAVGKLRNFDTALHAISQQADALYVMQSIMAGHQVQALQGVCLQYFNSHTADWQCAARFLNNNREGCIAF